jgi:hypothetical protein
MSAPGFLRRTIILVATVLLLYNVALEPPRFIHSADLREKLCWFIYGMATSAFITLPPNQNPPKH